MSGLRGCRDQWKEFPDWFSRYDFVVKTSPYTTESVLHVDRSEGPLCRVVRYQAAPPSKRAGYQRWLPARTHPIFFTSFFYKCSHGEVAECSREELCSTFRALLSTFYDLLGWAMAVYTVWSDLPFVDESGADYTPSEEERVELEDALYGPVTQAAEDWNRLGTKLFWEVELFSQYLELLSDMENHGKLPKPFSRFPGAITDRRIDDRYSRRLKVWRDEWNKERHDWPLRFGKLISLLDPDSSCERFQEVDRMRARLQELLVPILDAKGHDGAAEAEKHSPVKGQKLNPELYRRKWQDKE